MLKIDGLRRTRIEMWNFLDSIHGFERKKCEKESKRYRERDDFAAESLSLPPAKEDDPGDDNADEQLSGPSRPTKTLNSEERRALYDSLLKKVLVENWQREYSNWPQHNISFF
ncbi:hypothetical protein RND71_001043 [Anisodus tanguticus]|uniref:Uncharacterized protein n=1 Tax=Anisodus tanguticus TaxID=243964 RepID=A0AAE1VVK7_9SOLA|nr:hypothetical protein RND71_001043 [Anisodus tanguticus]